MKVIDVNSLKPSLKEIAAEPLPPLKMIKKPPTIGKTKKTIALDPVGTIRHISTEADLLEWIKDRGVIGSLNSYTLSYLLESLRTNLGLRHRYTYRNDLALPSGHEKSFMDTVYFMGVSLPNVNLITHAIIKRIEDKIIQIAKNTTTISRDAYNIDIRNVICYDNSLYMPLIINNSTTPGVLKMENRGCIRLDLIGADSEFNSTSGDDFHVLKYGGIGRVLMELTKDVIDVKVDTDYKAYVNLTFNKLGENIVMDRVYLHQSDIHTLRTLYGQAFKFLKSYSYQYIRSLNTILTLIRNLHCCTKEVALSRLRALSPVLVPLAPILVEAIKNDSEEYWTTRELQSARDDIIKAIDPTIQSMRSHLIKKPESMVDESWIPDHIAQKDKEIFIQGFTSWKYNGIPIDTLIKSGNIEMISEAMNKYLVHFWPARKEVENIISNTPEPEKPELIPKKVTEKFFNVEVIDPMSLTGTPIFSTTYIPPTITSTTTVSLL